MTIDEAIAHAREVAAIQRNNDKLNKTPGKSSPYYNTDCIKCAEEYEQLVEWLEELKDYRDKNKMVVRVDCENMDSIRDKIEELSKYAESQYNKAIDECIKIVKFHRDSWDGIELAIRDIDELKAGEKE